MSASNHGVRDFTKKYPRDGLHLFKNELKQSSQLGRHVSELLADVDEALHATVANSPIRKYPKQHFRIANPGSHGRHVFSTDYKREDERGVEHRLYDSCGPEQAPFPTPAWQQLVAYQVPLFNTVSRSAWGHVDLLAITHDSQPVVIELKRGSSNETPLRALVECVAHMIAVAKNWEGISQEILQLDKLKSQFNATPTTSLRPRGLLLAPESYWETWSSDKPVGGRVAEETRATFRELRRVLAEKMYPTMLASFAWDAHGRPDVREVHCEW